MLIRGMDIVSIQDECTSWEYSWGEEGELVMGRRLRILYTVALYRIEPALRASRQ